MVLPGMFRHLSDTSSNQMIAASPSLRAMSISSAVPDTVSELWWAVPWTRRPLQISSHHLHWAQIPLLRRPRQRAENEFCIGFWLVGQLSNQYNQAAYLVKSINGIMSDILHILPYQPVLHSAPVWYSRQSWTFWVPAISVSVACGWKVATTNLFVKKTWQYVNRT